MRDDIDHLPEKKQRELDRVVEILFEEFDALDYVLERMAAIRLELPKAHVAQVIDVHSSYLQVMGAIHLEDPVKVEQDLAELPINTEITEIGGDPTPELDA